MIRLFLKFADRTEAETVLASIGASLDQSTGVANGILYDVDVLFGSGVIHNGTGVFVEIDGLNVEQMAPIAGFHINMIGRGDMPVELAPYHAEPMTPACVFA